MKRVLVLLVALGALVAGGALYQRLRAGRRAPAPAQDAADGGPTAAERRAIAAGLSELGKGWRPAKDEDGSDTESRQELEDTYANYHPYFVRGDLDGDGVLDFAQAYVTERNGRRWFDVLVFFGRPGGAFSAPVPLERGISLADGDISVERSLVVITPDLSRDETRRWRWEPQERRFEDADATTSSEPQDEDAPDETPDERPRVRV